MHPNQSDRLVRTLSTTQTRRGTFTVLVRATAGTTLATLFAVPGHEEAAASCRAIGEGCTRTRQCCGYKKKKRICGLNPLIAPEPTCCVPEKKRCSATDQCCGSGELTCGGPAGEERCGIFIMPSDRAVKADFATVDGQAVLAQVASLPIQSWRYRTEDPAVRHIGPMAQDFAAAFNVGDNDRHIHVVDGQGVALAAIQGLTQELRALQAANAALAARVADLEGRRDG
jgi:hypothetical protein